MNTNQYHLLPLVAATAMVILPTAILAQTQPVQQKPGTSTAPAQAKPQPAATKPAPKPKSDAPAPAATSTNTLPVNAQPTLLGQYDNWGAYWAAPDGRKVCFTAARPNGSQSNRSRNPTYLFITLRPQDKVRDEVSVIVGSPFKPSSDATAVIGATNFAMVTQADGAWIKNTADETRMVEAMRKGADLVLKGTTERGLQSADTFSLRGFAQALDRVARECK